MSANIPVATFTTFEDEKITGLDAASRVQDLVSAVIRCVPKDAEEALSGLLDEMRIGPPCGVASEIEEDAEFWASVVTYEELTAYFIAAGRRLVRRQRGPAGRKRLVQRLLLEIEEQDREDFIAEAFRDLRGLIEIDARSEGQSAQSQG